MNQPNTTGRWILYSTTAKRYVNQPGSKKAFTRIKSAARKFPTKEAAQADACGDEYPISLD